MAAIGLVGFFLLVGLLVAIFGVVIQRYLLYLMPVIGFILLGFGILTLIGQDQFLERFMDWVKFPFQYGWRKIRGNKTTEATGSGGLFAYGFGYGAAASSCMAPVFLGVVLLGFTLGGFIGGVFVFGLYAFAIGATMVIISYFASKGGEFVQKLVSNTDRIKKISGLLLLFAGLFVLFYYFFGKEYIGGFLSF
jgi:cytochrome c biogenesis protein CcdA